MMAQLEVDPNHDWSTFTRFARSTRAAVQVDSLDTSKAALLSGG
jgi:hypothetical protein